jgi:hypothetical protein
MYGDAIADAVAHQTRAVLVLMSDAAEGSTAVRSELELARRFNKPIVPVMLQGYQPQGKGIIFYIGTSQWIPYDPKGRATLDALIASIKS